MSKQLTSTRLSFLVLLIMLVSACAPALPVATPEPAMQQPQVEDTSVQPPPVAGEPEDGPEAALPLVPIKSGLEATDPTTVELASGGPLLVEFFAFW